MKKQSEHSDASLQESLYERDEKFSRLGENWRDNRTASECLKAFCLSEHLSDVTFTFKKDQRKLPAHRLFLSMRSVVFERMFYGSMAEKRTTVTIDDIEPSVMEAVLRYIYCDVANLSGDNVLACLNAGEKYALTGLVEKCSEFLDKSISVTNVCTIYENAKLYNIKSLQAKCFEFIAKNLGAIKETQGFREISRESLQQILESDKLSSEESVVFAAAIIWAKGKMEQDSSVLNNDMGPKLRECLGDLLYSIRFPLMEIETFASVVAPTDILTKEEMVMIYQYLATKQNQGGNEMLGRFSCKQRPGITHVLQIPAPSNEYYLSGKNLEISVSSPIKIVSLRGEFIHNVSRVQSVLTGNVEFIKKTEEDRLVFQPPLLLRPQNDMESLSFVLIGEQDGYGLYPWGSWATSVTGIEVKLFSVPRGLQDIVFTTDGISE